MHDFKIEHFLKTHEGVAFPRYRTLTASEAGQMRSELARRLGLPDGADGLTMLNQLSKIAHADALADALTSEFDLAAVIARIGVHPDKRVYLNWHRFDNIDEIGLDDLIKYLDDIWYPSSDDIDIFDSTLSWVISISHDGTIMSAVLPGGA